MSTVLGRRVIAVWLAGAAVLLVGPVSPVTAQEGERRAILVNVLDRDGNRVPGLMTANFRGEFRGQPVNVVAAEPDQVPRRVAVLLDRSASQLRVGPLVLKSAEELINALTPHHSMVVGTVAGSVLQRSQLTSDRQTLARALSDVAASEPAGLSYLYGAVLQACQGLHGPGLGDVVCLFSDCDDTVSSVNSTKMLSVAAQTGVRVFAILTPSQRPPSAIEKAATSWIFFLAETTGGSVIRLEDFHRDLPTLCSMISDAYRVEVAFPKVVEEPRKWKLEVVGPDGKKLPKVQLVYPHMVSPVVPPK